MIIKNISDYQCCKDCNKKYKDASPCEIYDSNNCQTLKEFLKNKKSIRGKSDLHDCIEFLKMEKKMKCGDANPNGNVEFFYKGGCKKELKMKDAYRCVGCGGRFHLDCILKHFELEDGEGNARNILRKIKDYTIDKKIIKLCENGLKNPQKIKRIKK